MKTQLDFLKSSILTKEEQKVILGGRLNVRYCAYATNNGGIEKRLDTGSGCNTSVSCLGCWWEKI